MTKITDRIKIATCSNRRLCVQWCIARRNCRPPFIHRLSWEVVRSGPRGRRPGVIKSRIQTPVTRHRFGKRPDCTVCGAREQSSVSDAHRHGMLAATLNSAEFDVCLAASALATAFASALSVLLPELTRSVSRAFLLLSYVRGSLR